MKKKKYLLLSIVFILIIFSFILFNDKPLKCSKTHTLTNGVTLIDNVYVYEKYGKVNNIKVEKTINIDEHTESSYLTLFETKLNETYKSIKDKKITTKDHIVTANLNITEVGYILDSFDLDLIGSVMNVTSISDIDVAPSSIRIDEDYDVNRLMKRFDMNDYVCK